MSDSRNLPRTSLRVRDLSFSCQPTGRSTASSTASPRKNQRSRRDLGLTILYECQHAWPCSGKPAVIFHDRGKIFTSKRATQVLVDRLGITTQQAPPYTPSAKGTVEAVFTWVTRKFSHRLPGTTKSTPKERGAYESACEAEKAGMTFDVLEKLFIQAIVDGYMQ